MKASAAGGAAGRGGGHTARRPRGEAAKEGRENVLDERDDVAVLVAILRALRGSGQAEMAAAAGIHASTVSRYEEGKTAPSRGNLEALASAAGLPMWAVDGVWLPAIALARGLPRWTAPVAGGEPDPHEKAAALEQALGTMARLAVAEFLAAPEAGEEPRERQPEQQELAEGRPVALVSAATGGKAAAPALPEALWLEFARLCERLCAESVRAAANDAGQALEVARLAVELAELTPGEDARRWRLAGYGWGFVANAQRVEGDLAAAEASLAAAWRLWRAGVAAGDCGLAEWRLLDLEASLRRAQRRFQAALELLDRALAAAPADAKGRILLNRGFTLEQAGEVEAAAATLRQAAPLVAAAGEPRERFGLQFNLLVTLCHLGRYEDAEAGLPALRQLTLELGNRLDSLRVVWLSGRVAAGLGRRGEARAGFEEVRREFAALGNGYNVALASLELAILGLEEGRTGEVRALAGEMMATFRAQRVHREGLAALALFCQAAEAETATAELARRLLDYLERARRDPELPFEAQ
jgi:transcriptional regulator with XRE-family HTH domain